jgi:RNA polymerase sigma-B factor
MAVSALVGTERGRLLAVLEDYQATGDATLRNQLVATYQRLAYALASRFDQRGEELDDLNQIALIGLMKAIDRFDADRGVELTTFATATILGELKRHLRDRGWSVRVPRRIHDLHLRSRQAVDELTQELGRSPTVIEVAQRVGESLDDVVEALDAGGLRHNASLEAPAGWGDDQALVTRLSVGDENLTDVDQRATLVPLLARLPRREQRIVKLRYVAGCSQSEIATVVGISQMQVSRLLARSLAQLRQWAREAS